MAIVEMKRAHLLALEKDEQAILKALQKLSCFQITPLTDEEKGLGAKSGGQALSEIDEQLTRLNWAISKLSKLDHSKKPLLGNKPFVPEDAALAVQDNQSQLMDKVAAMEGLEREAGENRGDTSRIEAQIEQLLPWRTLSLPVGQIEGTRNTMVTLGTVQLSQLEQNVRPRLSPLCDVDVISTSRDQANVFIVCHQSAWQDSLSLLKEAGFAPVKLTGVNSTVSQRLDELHGEHELIEKKQVQIEQSFAAYLPILPDLKILYETLASDRERLNTLSGFTATERTFYIKGWVPARDEAHVTEKLKKVSPSACIEFVTPEEGDEPPVLLHNGNFVSPFENIVAGFSLPKPGGIDPTAAMTPFFLCFFGMMVSDAGYGLLMAVVILLAIKFLNPSVSLKRLMKILGWGGLATVVWGLLYNTVFGMSPLPKSLVAFDPINNALPVMAVCIGIGAIHLFAGLGMGAYVNIRDGKPLDAVYDQLSWFMLIVGLGMLVLPATAAIGQWVAIAGALIILVTAGRAKSRNPFKRLISGLGSLYGITSWVSDLLSYMRLFGMGLATGVIGMVINILVGMVFGAGPIGWVLGSLLFVGGHLFNAGINILGAYVHSCRLQYIEFFGKFYDDGGKPFMPLSQTNKYVYIGDAQGTGR